jgi:prepilin-type processing-associated H-X9-DG protein
MTVLDVGPAAEVEHAHIAQVKTSIQLLLLGCITYNNANKAWPDTLDAIADSVGGKEGMAKLMATSRTGDFNYRKPAVGADPSKATVLYEGFSDDAAPPKVVVGYADGHVAAIAPAALKRELNPKAK